MEKKYDFGGWATKANMKCSDGRVIKKNAFAECDGVTVPLVWNHQHNSPDQVLGHALLENREDGVYAYGTFNDTEAGQNAKLLVQNGDVNRLSIYANKLKQQGCDVIHGVIRELSLVLAGANPGAVIESVMMHGEDSYEEGYIYSGECIESVDGLLHSENKHKEEEKMETKKADDLASMFNELTDEQRNTVCEAIKHALSDEAKKEDSKENNTAGAKPSADDDKEETVEDVFNTLTEKQKTVVYALIGQALEDAGNTADDEEGGNDNMKHNAFDANEMENDENTLSHAEFVEIMDEAKRNGSLADTFLQHNITHLDYLFPDAKTLENTPGFIKRDTTWVSDVMNSVHKTPFSRIKSVFADITEDEARAKGYIKGSQKKDEVFTMLKRTTTPVTVYKHQSLDRDDVIDITEIDVISWLKTEMRMMLDEEIARAILVGDGRGSSVDGKINEQNIRPIWTDDDVYTVKSEIAITKDTTDAEKAKAFIVACKKSRKNYKGSGNPTMFLSEDMLTDCLLLEDNNGRVIYDTIDKLATALRVSKIVPVPVMEGLKREVSTKTHILGGIYVNLVDYNVGADKGGSVNMFDDFDIDYNKMKYLIETRCSGAMIKPYGAVAIEFVGETASLTQEAA